MLISSSDILNLSHALKDICEVDCETCPLLTKTLRLVAQSNLLQAHLLYNHTLSEACHQERRPYCKIENSVCKDASHRHIAGHDPRQENFNLNYIHEHPKADYDHDKCNSDGCD